MTRSRAWCDKGALDDLGDLPHEIRGKSAGISGGGAVPATHIPNNGVAVGSHVCFYAVGPKGLFCYDTAHAQWSKIAVPTAHAGGSIVALGNSVLIGGGFDPASGKTLATDVVDVITFAAVEYV